MTEGTSLVNYDEKYAAAAQQQAEEARAPGGQQMVSTRGGVLKFDDVELPGNQMVVVILDSVHENTYYKGGFDPDSPASPTCYAFGRAKDCSDMAPHESMQADPEYFEVQSEECTGCPHQVWGSADKGRGKACKNRERLAMLPAGFYNPKKGSRDFDLELYDDPEEMKGDIIHMKLPPTSLKFWANYLAQVRAAHNRPSWGVVTRVYLERDAKDQHHVKFEMLELLDNKLAPIVMARVEEASANIITPYSPPQERDEAAPPRGGIRGVRR